MRVLVVEDELKMASLLRRGLVEEGHAADVARTSGDDALWMARAVDYDAIVLDLMLPGRDGVEVCRLLRESGVWSPVLMLTQPRSRIEWPASTRARTTTCRSRSPSPSSSPACARSFAGVRSSGRPCSRSATSGSTRRPGRPGAARPRSRCRARSSRCSRRSCAAPARCSRLRLLEHAWDIGYENRSNVVDVYVRYLRDKVDRPFGRSTRELCAAWVPPPRRGRVVSRLPVRIRLTLAFTVAMAVVLAAVGAFLYVRLGDSLEEQLDEPGGAGRDPRGART